MAKSSKLKRPFGAIQNALAGLRQILFNLVLSLFEEINKQIHSRLSPRYMEKETEEHVRMLVKMFKFIVVPASLIYVFSDFFFFRENTLDSMLWGILVFVYSSFLPDLPSIYRKGKNNGTAEDLPWYKKYALLLFAPLFIWLLISGTRLKWSTTETFHNFRSVAVYCGFLLLFGSLFTQFPFTIVDMTELVSIPLYGLVGYLSHLKADRVL
jgi:hypothetical protein